MSPTGPALHFISKRISRRFIPVVVRSYLKILEQYELAAAVSYEELQQLLQKEGQREAARKVEEALAEIFAADEALFDAFVRAAALSAKATGETMDFGGIAAKFNASHPAVVQWARRQTANLIVQIQNTQAETIRVITALGAARGIPISIQARAIQDCIGMRPSFAEAPLRLYQEILDGDVARATRRRLSGAEKQMIRSRISKGTADEAFADDMRSRYTKRLMRRRALDIARTESLSASNAGQRMMWGQAVREKLLPSHARRVWIITPSSACWICRPIPEMNPEGVALGEAYQSPIGTLIGPPAHTNCTCGEGLMLQPGKIL